MIFDLDRLPWKLRASLLFVTAIFWSGIVVFFLVSYLPLVRFIASDEWVGPYGTIVGLIVLFLSFVACGRILAGHGDLVAWRLHRWEKRGKKGRRPEDKEPTMFQAFALVIAGPFFVWWLWHAVPAVLIPMATVIFERGPVAHEFVVARKGDGGRGPTTIVFEDHYFIWGAVASPPRPLWDKAQPGDTLVLRGLGNRWGVFYSSIEIK